MRANIVHYYYYYYYVAYTDNEYGIIITLMHGDFQHCECTIDQELNDAAA